MRRLIPTAILLAVVIIMCSVSNYTINKLIKDAKSEIDKCEELYMAAKYEEAKDCAQKFKKDWIKSNVIVSAYSNHCPLDDITKLSGILPAAIKEKDNFQFYSSISQIKTALDIIKREQSFTIQSLY